MKKANINYWVDLIIALAFVVSAISGLVFLLPMNDATVLGLTYSLWDQIHTWGSLLMIVGVLAHLVLHWKWIVVMTKKKVCALARSSSTATDGATCTIRRDFLRTVGLTVITLGAAAVGYKSLRGSGVARENAMTTENNEIHLMRDNAVSRPPSAPNDKPTSLSGKMQVACPKGVSYDPYPGRCRHYVDRDGDGYCDYSIPTES